MKTYLMNAVIHDGEHEFGQQLLVRADSKQEAWEKAYRLERAENSGEVDQEDGVYFLHDHYTQELAIYNYPCDEITEQEEEVLLRLCHLAVIE